MNTVNLNGGLVLLIVHLVCKVKCSQRKYSLDRIK